MYISFTFRSDTILMRGKNARIIRWDDVFKKLWEHSVVFQTNSSRTAVLFVDKQDPALVMDIARYYYYSMFSDKKATIIYLQHIFMLARAFLDKSLSLKQQLYWAWRVKSLFCIWRRKVRSLYFNTTETFKDIKNCCDGFVLYLLQINNQCRGSLHPMVSGISANSSSERPEQLGP